jgi:hypothetical protein
VLADAHQRIGLSRLPTIDVFLQQPVHQARQGYRRMGLVKWV